MQRPAARVALFAILLCTSGVWAKPASDTSASFPMKDVSVLEVMDEASDLSRGSYAHCESSPAAAVKDYPKLSSDNPLYGLLYVDRPGKDGTPADSGLYFVIDESGGPGKGYDRLYLDLDGDLDLAEEKPLSPGKKPARDRGPSVQEIFFETAALDLGKDPEGTTSIEVLPKLRRYEGRPPYVSFLQARVKKGEVTIGGRKYQAVLGHPHTLSARFNTPDTGLFLIGEGVGNYGWWGRDTLKAVRKVGDALYGFTASPSGDELTISPYTGDLGVFRVASGGRDLEGELTASGSLASPERNVAVGGDEKDGWPEPVSECRVPAGDYYPSYLRVRLGPLSVFLSNNYHGRGTEGRSSNPVRGIRIRPDTPFEFDFSNAPEVIFSSPAEGQEVKAGTTVKVASVLVDPELGIMVRGLDDTRRKAKKEYPTSGGETVTVEEDCSLDPKVLITRADGERVVEGVMPFG